MEALADCQRCPRLVGERNRIRLLFPDFHAAPVGSWGATNPLIWIVGLAPGLRGAGRTGRAFVGDASGEFLFRSLFRKGLATVPDAASARLRSVRITNVVKCVPPANAPKAHELDNCAPYLTQELAGFARKRIRRPRAVVALGTTAHRRVARAFGLKPHDFSHGGTSMANTHVLLLSSYHPSRLNVNTGRLSGPMLDAVLERARDHVGMGEATAT